MCRRRQLLLGLRTGRRENSRARWVPQMAARKAVTQPDPDLVEHIGDHSMALVVGALRELLSPYFEAERAPLEKVCVLFERVEQDEGIFCRKGKVRGGQRPPS